MVNFCDIIGGFHPIVVLAHSQLHIRGTTQKAKCSILKNRSRSLPIWSIFVVLAAGFVLCPVVGLFGEIVGDVRTDRLFENMGQADVIKFGIEDGIVTFSVTLEDQEGQDEIWIVDFQPFVYNSESPVDGTTGFLYANGTGSCSNIRTSHAMSDGYFGDDFFQSVNGTGTKALFKVYQRGDGYDANGTRIDVISYEGSMGTLLNCTMSDGTLAWQQSINTDEVVYSTVMYVTNVRPVKEADRANDQPNSLIAYVQSNIKLIWTLARRAIVNFVIASQSIYKPKMLHLVGRVIVEFDFAIVEPFLLSDGSIDPSRIHLEMGISTYTPIQNTSLLVFWDETTIEYVSEDPGNKLVEVLKAPPTDLLSTPLCTFSRKDYCRQQWEFEFVLEMSLETLSEEDPLDASGDFNFQYESFLCEDFTPSYECIPHDLPLWNVTADLTLQTVVDVVDEDLDVVKISVVKVVNDKGEDLRGGAGVKHKENVTVEVNFSPAFLRDRFDMELSLFMICLDEDASISTRGCLSTDETERYTAFLSDDFELHYDPVDDPLYQQSLTTTTVAPLLTSQAATTYVPTRFVSTDVTMRFSLIQDELTDSISLLPANQQPPFGSKVLTDDVFLQVYRFPPDSTNDEYVVFKVGSLPAAILPRENETEIALASKQLELYQNIFDAMPSESAGTDGLKSLLYSAYIAFPENELTYIGFEDPAALPCSHFSLAELNFQFAELALSPYIPDIDEESLQFLRDIRIQYDTLLGLTNTAKVYQDSSLTVNDFMMGPEWNAARPKTQAVADLTGVLSHLTLEMVWSNTDDNLFPIQNLLKSYILTKPLSTSDLIGEDLHDMLGHLKEWVNAQTGTGFSSLMATVIEASLHDTAGQNQILPLHVIFGPTLEILQIEFPEEDIKALFPELVSGDLGAGWTFYDMLLNLTVGYNGRSDGVDYLTESAGSVHAPMELGTDAVGYEVTACSIPWDYYSNIWVYRQARVVSGETLVGGWDHWADWSSCSASCAGGVKERRRKCLDNASPCTGSAVEVMTCNDLPCGRYRNEDGLVQHIFASKEAMNHAEMKEYCQKHQATMISYPHSADRDGYLRHRIGSEISGDAWVASRSAEDCFVLRDDGVLKIAACMDRFFGFCIKDFVIFVEGFAGNGQSIAAVLYGDNLGVGESTNENRHFVDYDLRRDWNKDIIVEEVQVAVFDNDELVVDLRFDGEDTTPTNWFKKSCLISSWPYVDILDGTGRRTHFQIYKTSEADKNLVLAERRLGACSKRTGWLVVVDGPMDLKCDWQESATYPLIRYSRIDRAALWHSSDVAKASRVVVSLKYYSYVEAVTVPPPPSTTTPPAPITYSVDMVAPPEDWQELNHQGYDAVRQVHTSEFTNLALSGDTAVYTMTAIYSVVEKASRRRRRRKRNLIESIQYPKVGSLPYRFLGCPNHSTHNPGRLSCDCSSPDFTFSQSSLSCEPVSLVGLPGTLTVPPSTAVTSSTPKSAGTQILVFWNAVYSITLAMLLQFYGDL